MEGFKKPLILGILYYALAFHAVWADTGNAIVIGATVSREGKYMATSQMLEFAYRLWAKQVNETGGLLGRSVHLMLLDDKSQADLVRTHYQTLIQKHKVNLVFAPYSTDLTYAASEVTEKYGYVLMASAATGEVIWQRGYKYVFGVSGIAKRYFIGFLDLAARNGLSTIAIVNEDTLFSKDAAEGAASWVQRLGMRLVAQHIYTNGAVELPAIISQLQFIQPDAVVLCAYPTDSYLFLKKLTQAGYRPHALAMSVAPALPDFYENAGTDAEDVFGPSQWEPDKRIPFPGTQTFIKSFADFCGKNPSYHAGAAYACCQLLQQGVEAVGAIDQKKIRDYIAALDTVTVLGRYKVDSQGSQIGHNILIIQWQQGKKEIVYPTKMKTAEPKFNMLER